LKSYQVATNKSIELKEKPERFLCEKEGNITSFSDCKIGDIVIDKETSKLGYIHSITQAVTETALPLVAWQNGELTPTQFYDIKKV